MSDHQFLFCEYILENVENKVYSLGFLANVDRVTSFFALLIKFKLKCFLTIDIQNNVLDLVISKTTRCRNFVSGSGFYELICLWLGPP